MGKITDYTALTATAAGDLLAVVDISDFTQAGTGTTKKVTTANLIPGWLPVTWYGADPTGAADSTAAFQSCITAAIAGGAEMVIPPGTYNLNTGGLAITGPLKIRGLGAVLSNTNGSFLTAAVQLNCNGGGGSASLFTFPYQGYLWGGLEISGVLISYTGSGNVFHLMNFTDSVFRDMQITLSASGSRAFYTTGSVSLLNVLFERVNIRTTSATRTVPMTDIGSATSGSVSNTTHFKCKFTNDGLDTTQYMVSYTCTGTGGIAFHYADNMIDCWFEHPYGGAYKSLAGKGIKVDGCSIWDVNVSTVGHSFFYFGADPTGGTPSVGVRVVGCGRNLNGPDGTTTWDVECESTTSQVEVSGFVVKPTALNGYTPARFNFHGCNDVLLLNNTSPQGAGVNGNSDTQVTNPSPTQLMISRGALTPAPMQSAGFAVSEFSNVTAWTCDPALIGGAVTPTSGTVYAMRMRAVLPAATNLACFIGATAGTLTSGQNFLGLAVCSGDATRAAGVLVGQTADQTTNWGTAGVRSGAMTGGPFTITVGAYYWLLMLMNWSVTGRTWGRNQNLDGTLANFGMSATTNMRCATNVTAVTALPSPLVVASNVATGTEFWGAVT